MKTIPLTKGEFAMVDDEDYEFVSQWNWHCSIGPTGEKYARRTKYSEGGKKTLVLMHNVIKPPPEGMINDHVDTNGLNNQKGNLRPCTRSQNCMNRGPRKRNKMGLKGIAFNKQLQKWVAFVRTKGKYYHLGVFKSPLDAAKAYNEKAIELFGDFARINQL